MNSLQNLLLSAQSPDSSIRKSAESALQALQRANPPSFLSELAFTLSQDSGHQEVRELAGIHMKNLLQNNTQDTSLSNLWVSLPSSSKQPIRDNTLRTLACPHKRIRNSAAQAVACIVSLDLPNKEWAGVLDILITNASNTNKDFKEASIMTLGYLCEQLPEGVITQDSINSILSPIVTCLTEQPADLVIVALRALKNSLKFIKENISNPTERNYLVSVLGRCCSHSEWNIRAEALQALCEIASNYYEYLGDTLGLFGSVTFNAIANDEAQNSIIAIEFWTIIADNEAELLLNEVPIQGYIAVAYENLVTLLLSKINERGGDEDDEWDLHKAAATAIGAVIQVLKDTAMPKVNSFIVSEISQSDPKHQETAALLIGMCMDGPSDRCLSSMLTSGLPHILPMLAHSKQFVRQTATWTVSKICEFHTRLLLNSNLFSELWKKLVDLLSDEPKIASHSCWAIMNVLEDEENMRVSAEEFPGLLDRILGAANSARGTDHQFRIAYYTTIACLFENAPEECVDHLVHKVPYFIELISDLYRRGGSEDEIGLVCSALHAAFSRARSGAIPDALAHNFMTIIINVFNTRKTVIEEGLEAIGALAGNLETRFEHYMPTLLPFILWALAQASTPSLLKVGTMCVGDLARALGERISDHSKDILPLFLDNLQSENVSSEIKVLTIENLGDLAAQGKNIFAERLPRVLELIEGAADATLQVVSKSENIDLFEYFRELREAILTFYVGLLQGLGEAKQVNVLFEHIPRIVQYTLLVTQDRYFPTKSLHSSALGLLGDIANSYQESVKQCLQNPQLRMYLETTGKSQDTDLQNLAKYSLEELMKLNN